MKANKRTSKTISVLAALAMLLCITPVSAAAESPESSITFTFRNDSITVSPAPAAPGAEPDGDTEPSLDPVEENAAAAYEINGTALTIRAAGTYKVTGECANGSIEVEKNVTDVTLVLDGLMLTSAGKNAPLACGGSSGVTLYVTGTNTLTDTGDEGKAIQIKKGASLIIDGDGTLNVIGQGNNVDKDTGESKGHAIKGADDATLTVGADVIINITAKTDGINMNNNLTLTGGMITVSAGDDAIRSDKNLTIDGANITIKKSNEGLEGANVYLRSGSANVTAADDGVNANAKTGIPEIVISSGSWTVISGGDGLDTGADMFTRGKIEVGGGTTILFAGGGSHALSEYDTALDADDGLRYTGGTLLAIDSKPPYNSQQFDAPITGDHIIFDGLSIATGQVISIWNSSGTELINATAVKTANRVTYIGAGLENGATYSVYVNDTLAKSIQFDSASNPGTGGNTGNTGNTGRTNAGGGGVAAPAAPAPESTTTTDPVTGVTTETTTETREDGTVVETSKSSDGSEVTTETAPDGSASVTLTDANGTTARTRTDADGGLAEAEATITAAAITATTSDHPAVTLPIELPIVTRAEDAAELKLRLPDSVTEDAPVKVEIPVERVNNGVVAVIVNEDGTEEIVKDCTVTADGVVLGVTGDVTVKVVDNTKTFTDSVPNWAAEEVRFVTSREIFNGTGHGAFSPNTSMSRGMIAQVLYNFDRDSEAVGTETFADASGKWYDDAANWANSIGVIKGYGGNFNGGADLTRQDLATVLYRYAEAKGYDTSGSNTLDAFSDALDVADYARTAMEWAVANGIIYGTDRGLEPTGSATRAQVAVMITRYVNNIVR